MYVFGATRALGRTLNTVVIWYNEPKKSSQLVSSLSWRFSSAVEKCEVISVQSVVISWNLHNFK